MLVVTAIDELVLSVGQNVTLIEVLGCLLTLNYLCSMKYSTFAYTVKKNLIRKKVSPLLEVPS